MACWFLSHLRSTGRGQAAAGPSLSGPLPPQVTSVLLSLCIALKSPTKSSECKMSFLKLQVCFLLASPDALLYTEDKKLGFGGSEELLGCNGGWRGAVTASPP